MSTVLSLQRFEAPAMEDDGCGYSILSCVSDLSSNPETEAVALG